MRHAWSLALVLFFIQIQIVRAASDSLFGAELGVENYHYLRTDPQNNTGHNSSSEAQIIRTDIQLSHKNQDENSWVDFYTDFQAASYLEAGGGQLVVRDLYLSKESRTHQTSWQLGRYRYDWSRLDQYWKLGYWQPQYIYDPLKPQTQGLTGFFIQKQYNNWRAVAFYTPIFVPHLGIDVQEKNGKLTSVNRWSRPVPEEYTFEGVDRQLVYDLQIPDQRKIILNEGHGFSLAYENSLFDGRLSYARKPINKLAFKRKQILKTQEGQPVYGDVTLYPVMTYHDLISFDVSTELASVKTTFSIMQDKPQPIKADGDWYVQNYANSQIVSLLLEKENLNLFGKGWDVSASFMRARGDEIYDVDADLNRQSSVIPSRLDLTQAYQLNVKSDFWIFRRSLNAAVSMLYDVAQEGSILQTQWTLKWDQQTNYYLGADILSVKNEDNPKQEEGFINQYRANDRLYAGLNYVF